MNKFSAKKLGEVLAFAEVGQDTIEKGYEALVSVLGEDLTNDFREKNHNQAEIISALADAESVSETVKTKTEKTGEKLKKMRDLYVGDEWDNPTELLEWSGFFEGAAIVHWRLVSGVAETLNNDELKKLAEEGIALHQTFLREAESHLEKLGIEKAK